MVSIGGFPNNMVDFQSYAGPGDKGLRNTELEGYQPISRIGETVMNSFSASARPPALPFEHACVCGVPPVPLPSTVDSYEFTTIGDTLTKHQLKGEPPSALEVEETDPNYNRGVVESKPHFHECVQLDNT